MGPRARSRSLPAVEPDERAGRQADYAERFLTPYQAAERGFVDAVIDPADHPVVVSDALDLLSTRREALPAGSTPSARLVGKLRRLRPAAHAAWTRKCPLPEEGALPVNCCRRSVRFDGSACSGQRLEAAGAPVLRHRDGGSASQPSAYLTGHGAVEGAGSGRSRSVRVGNGGVGRVRKHHQRSRECLQVSTAYQQVLPFFDGEAGRCPGVGGDVERHCALRAGRPATQLMLGSFF